MSKALFLLVVLVCAFAGTGQDAGTASVTQGSLFAHNKDGKVLGGCPLKSTSVRTEISGFLARVRVRQEFENSFAEAIEAVYTFPLSQNGAVDDMTMTIGTRTIRGKIMKRDDARAAYEQARTEGKTASLLDQERPNIFTQSVANIMPGEKIVVEISYVETLKYENGAYELVFPMTVGPRYNPASVTDASKVSPPVAIDRPGHDISIEVNLNAGVPVEVIRSPSHNIQQINFSPSKAHVTLKNEKTIPNKDFILRYDVTGGKIQDAVLAHRDGRGGFFTMIIQPPDKVAAEDRTPKEIVFVLDTSGSMEGFPIEKAKEAMKLSLEGLYPEDTFNFITFAGDTHVLFEKPVPATHANLAQAVGFLETRRGGGGTEMMKAIKAALAPSPSSNHLRIVCFMTDGYVSNEEEIIAEIQKHPGARVFSFGIGESVNRHLLDKMAEAGNGEVEYVSLKDDGSKAARIFYERVRTPLLTDLSIEWNGLPVADVYPSKLGDLFSAKPVIIHGRYTTPAGGKARLRGKLAGQGYSREIAVDLPEREIANDSLASLWARRRIDELSSEKLRGENASKAEEFDKQIQNLGLEFRLMTSFTSFVAVEDRVVNHNGVPTTVQVPVALPEGVEADSPFRRLEIITSLQRPPAIGGGASTGVGVGTGSGYGSGSGSGSGSSSGTGSGSGGGGGGGGGKSAPGVSAVVSVTSSVDEVVRIESADTQITANITSRAIQSLPGSGRSANDLLTLSPGSTSVPSSGLFQVDGASGNENSFVIDGADKTTNGLLEGRTLLVVEPEYPEAAGKLGKVVVEIEVDPDGIVEKAKAVSGPEALRGEAETAAKLSRFAPAFKNRRAVRTAGTLVYKFVSPENTEIFIRKMKIVPATAEDKRAMRLGEVLHVWLYEALMRMHAGASEPTANENRFVRDGKAHVRIELSKRTASVTRKLKDAGVEIESEAGNTVKGRVPIKGLASLSEIGGVRYVMPLY